MSGDVTGFTPGPWLRMDRTVYTLTDAKDSEGRQKYSKGVPEQENAWWAYVQKSRNYISDEEAEANARLISAAPEMFEALNLLMQRIEKTDASWIIEEAGDAVDLAISALAKARGDTP